MAEGWIENNRKDTELKVSNMLLDKVLEECLVYGWDGDRAEPLKERIVLNVKKFISNLPVRTKIPNIGVEADGSITLEWYVSKSNLVSILVKDKVSYAGIIEDKKVSGKCMVDNIPNELLQMIERVWI